MKDIDERIMEYRIRQKIRQDNRKWVGRQIVKVGFGIAAFILFIAYLRSM